MPLPDHVAAGHPPAPRLPALLLGLGLGGFLDVIVMHQLLQWHHLISDTPAGRPDSLDGLQAGTLADGLLHVAAGLLVLAGILALLTSWRRGRRAPSWRSWAGLLLVGWGAFDLLDGLVNHHLLGLHHVRDDLGGPLAWDLGFLALGAALVVGGGLLHRSDSTRRNTPGG